MGEPELRSFFSPRGCAVLGASSNPSKAGHQIVRNMLEAGFSGGLYPVNLSGGHVLGLEAHSSVSQIPGRVEMVVQAVPAPHTDSVIDDLRRRQSTRGDIQALVVVAAGFAETGTAEGSDLQNRLLEACREMGIRVLGPNCVGVVSTSDGVDTTFILGGKRLPGGISFVSQSGAVGAWLIESWASGVCPVGFNKFVSVGNMADVELIELLRHFRDDQSTTVVGLYLEGYRRGRELAVALGELAARKPVVVLKVGRSSHGAQAAHSHTGSLAGSDRVYDGVMKQVGVRRASSIEELSDTLQAFDRLPLPTGPGVFLITQAGGPGIYCADVLAQSGDISFARIEETTKEALRAAVPPFASVCRPEGHADITAAATSSQHAEALRLVMRDEGVDAVLLLTVPVLFMPAEEVARGLVEVIRDLNASGIDKPFLPVLLAGEAVEEGRRTLDEAGLLSFVTPDRAARALAHLAGYARFRAGAREARWSAHA